MEDDADSEEDPEAYEERRVRMEQSERLLQQMRKCVLVHHQLSCLLIHGTAMQAGLYKDGTKGPLGASAAFVNGEGASIERSIQNLGGSTARLFSMALHDNDDFQAMGETLQERVDDMIEGVKGELKLAGYTAPSFDNALQDDSPGRSSSGGGASGSGAVAWPSPEAKDVAELERECEDLESELALERDMVANLGQELEQVHRGAEHASRSLATACFDEVRRAEERNAALESLLLQLQESPDMALPEARARLSPLDQANFQALSTCSRPRSSPPQGTQRDRAKAMTADDAATTQRTLRRSQTAAGEAAAAAEAFEVSLRQLDEQMRGKSEFWDM